MPKRHELISSFLFEFVGSWNVRSYWTVQR